jgi:hypothetical protein
VTRGEIKGHGSARDACSQTSETNKQYFAFAKTSEAEKSEKKHPRIDDLTSIKVFFSFLTLIRIISEPGPKAIKNYSCNLQIFVIGESVCPWRAFPDYFNVCGHDEEPTQVK